MAPTRRTSVIAPLAALAPLAGMALGLGGLAPSTAMATPSFTLLGLPEGAGVGGAFGLSADGRAAAGWTSGFRGFHWTADGGRNDFGFSIPTVSTRALGISGDGLTAVGGGNSNGATAFRWSQSGGYQNLGTLPGYANSEAKDANHDGSIIVGTVESPGGTQGFRWTEASGMQGLGFGTRVQAISGNGNVIVGELGLAPNGFTWTEANGIQFLPSLGGAGGSYVNGINFTGDKIVGVSGTTFLPTIWLSGIATELLSGDVNTRLTPYGLSEDGSVVAGQLRDAQGRLFAGVWTAPTGAIRLSDYLIDRGVTLPVGISLEACTGISADGTVFTGYSSSGGPFAIQGWVATIPCPGVATVLAVAGMLATRRRRA